MVQFGGGGGVGTSRDWLYKPQKSYFKKFPQALLMFSPQKKAFGVFLGFKNLDLNISPIFQLIKKIKAASHTTVYRIPKMHLWI